MRYTKTYRIIPTQETISCLSTITNGYLLQGSSMCGIVGAYNYKGQNNKNFNNIHESISKLSFRGPDANGIYRSDGIALGHTRLSIHDLSQVGNQPMQSDCGNYYITYNGEIYNFKELRKELISKGYSFKSASDTEVLLKIFLDKGEKCLSLLNGFFSFAIYDKSNHSIFAARDRFGIKPFLYNITEGNFYFSSEMKGLMPFIKNKQVDHLSLRQYFQLTYIPAPNSILKGVKKLMPGEFLTIRNGQFKKKKYYSIQLSQKSYTNLTYLEQQKQLASILEKSVTQRLQSDAPLGAFLSGGIDSSIITGLASKHVSGLKTFSIGFKDNHFLDETDYALLVAKHFNTDHTVIKLSTNDYLKYINDIINYIDEPFADSSAMLVNILSKHVREHVTVALSGDGADEIFAGYEKYRAEYLYRQGGLSVSSIKALGPLLKYLPKSRENKFGNIVRKLFRFSEGVKLSDFERYIYWCSFNDKSTVDSLFKKNFINQVYNKSPNPFSEIESHLKIHTNDFNQNLYYDLNLVLPGDMLTKVDMMSMANSLEVRVPFLDHNVVDYAFTLPPSSKIDSNMKKKILQDTFKTFLPKELYSRPKQGFSIPLMNWFKNDFWEVLNDELLEKSFIEKQGIFEYSTIEGIKNKIKSSSPGDIQALVWSLVVFQIWWKNNILDQKKSTS